MYTYLIIDDEELIRKGTIKKLSKMSDKVSCIGEAENGLDGIEKIKALHPDIVILDMQMPFMDGMKLLPYLAENYPKIPLIVISGFRDFDYIKQAISSQAIDYILKPFGREAIEKCMNYAISNLEKDSNIQSRIVNSTKEKEKAYYKYDIEILNNLILGYHTDTIELSSQKLNFINNTHNLILFTLNFTCNISQELIQEWIDENSYGDLALFMPHKLNQQMGFLIFFTPQNYNRNINQLSSIVNSLIFYLKQQNINGVIGISNTHSKLKELNNAFLETTAALNQQPVLAIGLSYYYYKKETAPVLIIWERQDEFLFKVEAGMTEEVRNLMTELFRYFQTISDCTLGAVKYYCYYLSDQCRLILNYYLNQNDIKTASNSIQNIVNQIFLLENLEEYYMQFFTNISEMLKPQSVYAVGDVIEKIQTYMQRNYQKNLTQEYISSLFYLNRSYLSTLFKEKTGEKFIDYLNNIRIEKSKELLSGSDKKMYQIAKSVGYENVKYFFRIFKKKVGMTPEKYREITRT